MTTTPSRGADPISGDAPAAGSGTGSPSVAYVSAVLEKADLTPEKKARQLFRAWWTTFQGDDRAIEQMVAEVIRHYEMERILDSLPRIK